MTSPLRYARLASRALIRVTGPDWRAFLQGLLTQDVETLAEGELRFAALLTPQGRLMFDLFVLGEADGALLDVVADQRQAIITRLSMYRLRAKVEITADERSVSVLWNGAGPGFVIDPRLPALGLRGYGARPLSDAAEADEAAYDAHRLSLGIPGSADWGEEKAYPIEANFDLLNGIDFRKGCFVGQETTSRMKRRGQIKTRMLPITFDGPPPAPGAEVLAGDLRAGEVLSGVDGRAMAAMRLDRIDGATLTVDGRPVTVERPGWMMTA
ncbi:MAG: folate-binding protein YgfZ [Caulobacter sp.]|nr:folate-binding protein YgfZ [Caulobacter sp.]